MRRCLWYEPRGGANAYAVVNPALVEEVEYRVEAAESGESKTSASIEI
jgi:hypothetical protein